MCNCQPTYDALINAIIAAQQSARNNDAFDVMDGVDVKRTDFAFNAALLESFDLDKPDRRVSIAFANWMYHLEIPGTDSFLACGCTLYIELIRSWAATVKLTFG
jgi:hypothetical protein